MYSLAASGSRLYAASLEQGMFYSVDNGSGWSPRSIGAAEWEGTSLAGDGSDIFAVLARNNGNTTSLYVSHDNGTTWGPVTTLPTKSYINSVTVSGPDVYAMTNGGIFQSADRGKTWKVIMDSTYSKALVTSGPNLVKAGYFIYYSTDEGKTWNEALGKMQGVLALGTTGPAVICSDANRIYRSLDNGESWSVVNDTLAHITTLASSGTALFAGRFLWPVPVSQSPINDPLGGLFRSTDQGKSWQSFESGLTDSVNGHPYPLNIYSSEVYDSNIFVSTNGGVYISKVSKANWNEIGQGLPYEQILSIYANDSYLYAGVDMGGVWRRPISQIITPVEKQPVSPVPTAFRLEQNYPNPFNPTTTIPYKIPVRAHVRLTVFNALGQQVETLVNREKAPGQYQVQFNASQLSSGVYFYRIKTTEETGGNFAETKKLVVIK